METSSLISCSHPGDNYSLNNEGSAHNHQMVPTSTPGLTGKDPAFPECCEEILLLRSLWRRTQLPRHLQRITWLLRSLWRRMWLPRILWSLSGGECGFPGISRGQCG